MQKDSDSQLIKLDLVGVRESIALVTLNRAARANAIIPEMAAEFHETVLTVKNDDSIKAVVLTGAGKHFCPGMDGDHALQMVDNMANGKPPAEPYDGNLRHLHAATIALFRMDKPVIAAINGSAAAGGLDLALACDYRMTANSAMFAESYVKIGLPPLNGGAWFLRRIVGPSKAARMLLSAQRLTAQDALNIGLVDEIVDAASLLARAIEVAEQMSIASIELMRFIKNELRAQDTLENALARSYIAGIQSLNSEECRSAIQQLRR